MNEEWIGVDLDGTLAVYDGWVHETHIGAPVDAMVQRVKNWLANGHTVKIFTARVTECGRDIVPIVQAIDAWCLEHIGQILPVTNVKDFGMAELWDDRCVQVDPNTGRAMCASRRGLD